MFSFYLGGFKGKTWKGRWWSYVEGSRVKESGELIRAFVLRFKGGGSFVILKLNPPPFLGRVPISRYTGSVQCQRVIRVRLFSRTTALFVGRWGLVLPTFAFKARINPLLASPGKFESIFISVNE